MGSGYRESGRRRARLGGHRVNRADGHLRDVVTDVDLHRVLCAHGVGGETLQCEHSRFSALDQVVLLHVQGDRLALLAGRYHHIEQVAALETERRERVVGVPGRFP